jgi:hypothetical protein
VHGLGNPPRIRGTPARGLRVSSHPPAPAWDLNRDGTQGPLGQGRVHGLRPRSSLTRKGLPARLAVTLTRVSARR